MASHCIDWRYYVANYIDKIKDKIGNVIYPITLTKAVYKENTSTTLDDLLGNKVDKIAGKQLSTSDYTTSEKTKLSGISAGSNKTQNSVINGDIVIDGTETNVYTHPTTHPSSIIVQDTSNRFVTDAEKSTWNGKQNALGYIPLPISGGVLENYREKLTTVSAANGSINLSLGNVFQHSPSGNRTYSITNAVNGQAHSFTLIINMGSTVRTLTFPASIKWQGGEMPDLSTANKTYVLTFVTINGGANWLGMFGGEF